MSHSNKTMPILVVNRSKLLSQAQVDGAISAINKQISEHFAPEWFLDAHLTYTAPDSKNTVPPDQYKGSAIVYLLEQLDDANALGYHTENFNGYPYGMVGLDYNQDKVLDEGWSVTFSHEVLELLLDTYANLWAIGPHPKDDNKQALFWYEACDAVQGDDYLIDQVKVSNFVLPHYFTSGDETDFYNDYLAKAKKQTGPPLKSFGVRPGGYMGFYDIGTSATGQPEQIFGDRKSLETFQKKQKAPGARRSFMKTLHPHKASHKLTDRTKIAKENAQHVVKYYLASKEEPPKDLHGFHFAGHTK